LKEVVTEMLPQPVYETDISGRITYTNMKAFEHFGYSGEDFNRKISIFDLIAPIDHEQMKDDFKNLLQKPGMNVKEYTARKKDESNFPVSVYAASIVHDDIVTGTRCFTIDLTEHFKTFLFQ
jgi:PAS domain S-box-containing protein